MNPNAYFTTLARYNVWATARLLAALAAVPEDDYRRDVGLFFRSIHGTLAHLFVGEHQLWFRRFDEGISPVVALDAASLPFAATLAHVFNHGTHHRGQITAALTALGQPCPELDMVYFLQAQPAQESPA
ncbi:MAG: damage-inducible protein DinB [Polaromonas sp.]|nr:damage-inducible protein DinB [Polaromonas sp.]